MPLLQKSQVTGKRVFVPVLILNNVISEHDGCDNDNSFCRSLLVTLLFSFISFAFEMFDLKSISRSAHKVWGFGG